MRLAFVTLALLAGCQQAATPQPAPKATFAGMDGNGDGSITRFEHAAASAALFRAMDADNNRQVTVAEMTAAAPKLGLPATVPAAKTIEALDYDVDGQVSAEEYAEGAAKRFTRLDTNRDGQLSQTEYDAGNAAAK